MTLTGHLTGSLLSCNEPLIAMQNHFRAAVANWIYDTWDVQLKTEIDVQYFPNFVWYGHFSRRFVRYGTGRVLSRPYRLQIVGRTRSCARDGCRCLVEARAECEAAARAATGTARRTARRSSSSACAGATRRARGAARRTGGRAPRRAEDRALRAPPLPPPATGSRAALSREKRRWRLPLSRSPTRLLWCAWRERVNWPLDEAACVVSAGGWLADATGLMVAVINVMC